MNNLMLYIHIPFCEKKCNYCDFISFKTDENTKKVYVEKLITEIENKSHLANDKIITSIFIGGGTPSLIDSKFIIYILESIYKYYKISDNAEITIESNPNSITKDKLEDYKRIGINRISIGLQSVNNDELQILGRIHTYEDFLKAYDNIVHVGFHNINVDIISGIPYQTLAKYKNTLKNIIRLKPTHLSIYNLIIEPNTIFYQMQKDSSLPLPLEKDMIEIDNLTYEFTEKNGYKRYEISNFAKENFECKHNLGYWSFNEYLGFGLNSSSFLNLSTNETIKGIRLKNRININEYLNLDYKKYIIEKNINYYYEEINNLTEKEMMSEYLITGLRKIIGITNTDFINIFKCDFFQMYGEVLHKYINNGLINIENNDKIYLTKRGLDVSNTILSDFI